MKMIWNQAIDVNLQMRVKIFLPLLQEEFVVVFILKKKFVIDGSIENVIVVTLFKPVMILGAHSFVV